MKVKLLVEFEVEGLEPEDEAEMLESHAKSAASEAAYQVLCLTRNGVHVHDDVEVHADGYGNCCVKLGEDHE
jgi:hypothetical protein